MTISSTLSDKKKELRSTFLNQRRNLSVQEWKSLSARVTTRVLQLIQQLSETDKRKTSLKIHCYLSLLQNREVNTEELIAQLQAKGHLVGIPKTDMKTKTMKTIQYTSSDQLEAGPFGLLEPAFGQEMPLSSLDLVILPNVALDLSGGRLGYGMGFYDRFLEEVPSSGNSSSAIATSQRPMLISPAFEISISSQLLPMEKTDIRINWIVTEERILQTDSECQMQ